MANKQPALSIVIPTLNEEKYLPTLLTDLSRQTDTDFEVIHVDGNSDDRTIEKAKLFAHRLPKLTIISTKTRNVCFQRNLGAASATADRVLFMDADNRIPVYFLSGLKYRLDQTNPDIFSVRAAAEGDSTYAYAITTIINLYLDLYKNTSNPLTLEATIGFKKDLFMKLKGFNPKVAVAEGNEIVKKAVKKGYRFEIYKDPTYVFSLRRLHKDGTLRTIGNLAQLEINRLSGKITPRAKAARLYPMLGGGFFDQETADQNFFDSLIQKLRLSRQRKKVIDFARSLLFLTKDSENRK